MLVKFREAIDGMSVDEKLKTMDYLWSSLSRTDPALMPEWHLDELRATETRVAAGMEKPIPWEAAKAILKREF